MPRLIDPILASPGDWVIVPARQLVYGGQRLSTFAVVATGNAAESCVGRAHPINGVPEDRARVAENARLFAASKAMAEVLLDALAFHAAQFDGPEDEDLSVSGADTVEWFAQWRLRARAALTIIEP